jgi:ABC-type transporter Mla subunit MlaD
MEEGRRNIAVGAFVLVGLFALGILIVLFGQGPTWLVRGGTYPLHVHFDAVSGIRKGTQVTVRGMEVGRVEDVLLLTPHQRPGVEGTLAGVVGADMAVDVVLAIRKEFLIPRGSTAQTTEPMLGQGRPPIEIIPGPSEAEPLVQGASITGKIQGALDSIFPKGVVDTFDTTARQIGDAAGALTPVLDEVKVLLEQRSPRDVDLPGGQQGNLSSAVARLDSSLKHFNEVLGDPQVKSHLRETVTNVHEMSEKGKKVMGDLEIASGDAREFMAEARKFVGHADQTLGNVESRFNDVAQATVGTLDRADRFLDYLNVVGDKVTRGEGNVGQLVNDNKLYEALVISAERLALAVEEFRALVAEWREGKVRVAL